MTIPAMVRRPMRRTFGGAAEFGVNARCGDLGDGLAAPDQRPGIEQQQRGNHRRLNNVAKHDLQDDRCFQHPGHRRPQFGNDASRQMLRDVGHGVSAEFSFARPRVRTGQSMIR
ncbi:hypothetical protein VNG72_19325 [Acidiphilium acidophilum]|nr:hypothetical protein [Acidiphilium acidophilum]